MQQYNGTDNLEVMEDAINYNDYLVQLIMKNANKEDKILDFGAGIGTYAKVLQQQGFNVTCLEPDKTQAKVIQSQEMSVIKSLDEIEDNSLDFIYSLNVLEHIEDDLSILKQLKNKLKPEGRVLLYLPAFELLYSSMDEKVGHFRRYNFQMLTQLAKASELFIEKKAYVDCLGFFVTLLYKLIGNKEGDINRRSIIIYDRIIFPISKVLDKVCHQWFGKNVLILLQKTYK